MSQRALGSTHGYLRIDGSVGGGLSRADHMRTDEVTVPGDGTTTAVVAGLLRSYG